MEQSLTIDPWSSVQVKDYDAVMKNFGIENIKNLGKKLPFKHHYFTRGIVFGHKDFGGILDALKNKKRFVMMTGLMPSGKFHLGHKVIADLIILFQKLGAECYVTAADIEAHLTRNIEREEARRMAIEEYLVNYIALGLEKKNTKFYFQSEGPREYMNLSKYASKKTTMNELRAIYGELSPEKIMAIFTQVADILHPQLKENGGPRPVVVPVGVDQLPHLNLARDIASRMKQSHGFTLPSAVFVKMFPGLQGGKMSSSKEESYIALTDAPEVVEKKIRKYAFSGGQSTVEEHRRMGGNPDVDVCYQWLTFFEEDDKKLKKIHDEYLSGKLLTSELKEITIKKINSFLKEHQKKRELARKKVDQFI